MGIYNIDVVGTCNLKCPSCARRESYSAEIPSYKGLMDFDLFVRILDRIEKNRPGERHRISTFVWGEPLMHNRIGDIISEINKRGWESIVSTNGNATKHLESAIRAQPTQFSISLSGFLRESYNATHYKGDVEVVISTIFRAWNLCQRHSPKTDFMIHYHLYKDNGGENLATFQRIVRALGCAYSMDPATVLSLDDVLAEIKGTSNLSTEKTDVAAKLIFSMKELQALSVKYNNGKCPQIEEDRVTITPDGSVSLCCGVFGDKYNLAPSYLETTEAEIFAARDRSSACGPCMEAGIPFVGAAFRRSPIVKQAINETLIANGGDKYVSFGKFGTHNRLLMKGSLGVRVKHAAKRVLRERIR